MQRLCKDVTNRFAGGQLVIVLHDDEHVFLGTILEIEPLELKTRIHLSALNEYEGDRSDACWMDSHVRLIELDNNPWIDHYAGDSMFFTAPGIGQTMALTPAYAEALDPFQVKTLALAPAA